ncbi:zinc transporter ZitB [Salmonella enterica subsp. enterica serovar Typhimurium]|nr:zinc transporter ZitB [Salmonella enterica subsp. enterica serovar Typhimurium]
MAHSHSHADSHLPKDNNARRLLFAFIVTAGFMLLEVVGGILSGSLALLADAGHMLTDAAALLFALLAVQFSRRPPTVRHTFGWLRLTTLAAFVNAIALVVITLLIVWEAIERFYTPRPVAGNLMMVIAVAGLLANLFAFWILHRGSDEKKPERARCRATCDGRFAGFRRRNSRRVDHYLDRLDASGPDSLYSGFGTGATQRLAFVKR